MTGCAYWSVCVLSEDRYADRHSLLKSLANNLGLSFCVTTLLASRKLLRIYGNNCKLKYEMCIAQCTERVAVMSLYVLILSSIARLVHGQLCLIPDDGSHCCTQSSAELKKFSCNTADDCQEIYEVATSNITCSNGECVAVLPAGDNDAIVYGTKSGCQPTQPDGFCDQCNALYGTSKNVCTIPTGDTGCCYLYDKNCSSAADCTPFANSLDFEVDYGCNGGICYFQSTIFCVNYLGQCNDQSQSCMIDSPPTAAPFLAPTPTTVPKTAPTTVPSSAPTTVPSSTPTTVPSSAPTTVPSSAPTTVPPSAPAPSPQYARSVRPGTMIIFCFAMLVF